MLVDAINRTDRVRLFISASAVGYYPSRGCYDEYSHVKSDGFLAGLCRAWEAEAGLIRKSARLIITRFGVVLSPEGGAFLQLIRPLQSRLATVIGSGNQPFTWIALTDLIGAMGFVIDQPGWSGVFNFVTPEQMIPPNGIQDVNGNDIAWESCVTMNNHWGYCANDHFFKPAPMLIKKLVECVSKGGNLLLNVGPDARGNIPEESIERLAEIGKWMKKNGESIYGCGKAGIEKPDFGRVTRHGNHLYFHVYENTVGPLPLPGVKKEEIQAIRYVATGAEIPVSTSWVHSDYPTMAFADLGEDPVLPDGVDTVIDVILKK